MKPDIAIKTVKFFVRLIVGFVFGGFACMMIVLFVVDAYGDLKYGLDVEYILGENWFEKVFLVGGSILSIVFALIGGVKINRKWTIFLVTVMTFFAISILSASILAIPLSDIDYNSEIYEKIASGIIRRAIFKWSIVGTCAGIATGFILARRLKDQSFHKRLKKPSPLDDL